MGWFSDSLFGERKRIDQSKIDDMMAPTRNLINQQNELAQGMLDPNSEFSRRNQATMRTQYADAMAQQSQDLQSTAAMRGVSPGQAMQMQRAAGASQMGQFGGALGQQQGQQFQQGLGLLGQVTGLEKGMNEQRANTYMQQINAHNQRRAGNVGFAKGIAGGLIKGFTGLDIMGGGQGGTGQGGTNTTAFQDFLKQHRGTPTPAEGGGSDIALKEHIELVGKSPKGINIYEFDYKDKSYGKGRYRGVMAQEVPNASFKHHDGYLWVDYNKVDVDFERIN